MIHWRGALALAAGVLVAGCAGLPPPAAARAAPMPPSPPSALITPAGGVRLSSADDRTRTAPLPWGAARASSLLPGDVLIADSGAHRLLMVTPGGRVVWRYPGSGGPSPLGYMDDAFFTPGYLGVVTNEENSNTIAIIGFRSRRVVWSYGQPGVAGSSSGLLNTPDDALVRNTRSGQQVTVADINSERVLVINRSSKAVVTQYGRAGVYRANPPRTLAAPNGAFPGPAGSMLITEIGGNSASLISSEGRLEYTIHFPPPLSYPSDANFTPNGNIICAFYTKPGAIAEFSPSGKLLWLYRPTSGSGALNHPSLARMLSNGLVLATDDLNDRVIVINPSTNSIVWQYGHRGVPGLAPGYLVQPDGLDLLPTGANPGGPIASPGLRPAAGG